MKWLTEKEVAEAAAKSKRVAITCSKKHWEQNYTATTEEVEELAKRPIENEEDKGQPSAPPDGYLCALCERYGVSCDKCPLGPNMCCSEYHAAADAFEEWLGDKTEANFTDWQAKAKLMYERLCKL